MTAVVFLDIDGVLNPYQSKNPLKWSQVYRKTQISGDGLSVRPWTSSDHGPRFLALPATTVWATTWTWYPDSLEMYALASGFPAGMPRIDWSDADRWDMEHGNCGKREGLKRYLALNEVSRFVWVDDFLGPVDYGWAGDLEIPTLLIKPNPATGVRPEDFEAMQKFLDSPVG